jgi:hypothetical protein
MLSTGRRGASQMMNLRIGQAIVEWHTGIELPWSALSATSLYADGDELRLIISLLKSYYKQKEAGDAPTQ